MKLQRLMTYEEWYDNYRPIREELFDSYGTSVEFVNSQDALRVWTYISCDGDFIKNGFHSCDRVGYLITEIPYDPEIDIVVEVIGDDMI